MSENRVWLAGTLVLVGLGLLFAEPTLLAAALVPLAFLGYTTLSERPGDVQLRVERTLTGTTAAPGEQVTVGLTVENEGDRTLLDLRVLDGHPDLTVTEGSPRVATALAPGESTTVEYELLARRGVFDFGPARARVRSLSGGEGRTFTVDVSGADRLVGTPASTTVSHNGTGRAHEVGGGVEFHNTRKYRPGDPLGRIDWRHVAKTGEFVTVQYREQSTARTALVVDIRQPVRGRHSAGYPSLASLSVDAAESIATGLGNRLCGVGAVGLDADIAGDTGVVWLDARSSRVETLFGTVRTRVGTPARVRSTEETDQEGATGPTRSSADGGYREPATDNRSDDDRWGTEGASEADDEFTEPTGRHDPDGAVVESLSSVPEGVRVVLCTPALDGWPIAFARLARKRGHDVTVLTPRVDVSGAAGRLVDRRRRGALERLDEQVRTVEYEPGRPVELDGGIS